MKKFIKLFFIGLLILIGLLALVYTLGPRPATPNLDPDPLLLSDVRIENIEQYVDNIESEYSAIKEGNKAEIVWASDSAKSQTEYCFVYLHGFSASHGEGNDLHRQLAQRYGANLYLSRLAQHGLEDVDAFAKLSPEQYLHSAKEAIAIGKVLGKKVILLTCSTGSSLGLYLLAAEPADSPIAAIMTYSPNIDLFDKSSDLLVGPWGLQLARLIFGGKYRFYEETNPDVLKNWNNRYRLEGILAMKQLLKYSMRPEVFAKIKQPLFMGYYYKNEQEQDHTVSVKRMLEMFDQVATPEAKKRKIAFPEAKSHVICSKVLSKEYENVENASIKFLEEVLSMNPLTR